ncbi:SMC-Scp complex subunit ScpB [Bacillus horti]|uniref:Segregation and condensation protein B n=1 Tax=Caldalkalibacillus horti TaxID=77523 RepID=A0ABT9VU95_9BACI|nr:SMC-Scp complex subunit ScpB [Bacillus horti]MDQ0164558.1 segregation and condensation protein B [Bacillus horti]
MEQVELKAIIEGLLFVSGEEGIDVKQIADVVEEDKKKVIEIIEEMKQEYAKAHRGIQIIEVAGAYQMTTLQQHASYYEKLAFSPTQATLSQAALETLSIVAYRQPMTKVEIEEIRGVKSDRAITTLIKKALIKEVGRMEGAGRPILYGTTKEFLDYFGLNRLEDLPSLSENPDLEEIEQEADLFFSK